MSTNEYTGIRLAYDEIIKDVQRMIALAGPFLQPESIGVLRALITDIESVRIADTQESQMLGIRRNRDVKTIWSTWYRDSDKGQDVPVYGTLCFQWQLKNWDRGRRKQVSFDLVGVATTSIRVLNENNDVVAHWQFEVGDASSPGCHFHASVNRQELLEGPFPDWLKIPRLAGLLLSPMDGLEFLLGELFQSKWEEQISQDSQDRNGWADSQARRLSQLLTWQAKQVRDNKVGTPWMSLKRAKPPIDVLLEK